MRKFVLNKILDEGTIYRAERDKFYVVRRAGTNSTTRATLSVAGIPCLEIVDVIAPKEKINTNLFGTLDLEDNYVVIPPDKVFSFSGSSGSELRIAGEVYELAPGEAMPTAFLARYTEQGKKYLTYIEGTYSHGTDVAWPNREEHGVVDFTAPVKEKYTFKYRHGSIVTNIPTPAEKQFAVRFYVDDKPLDNVEYAMGEHGIEIFSCYLPPSETVNFEFGTLKDMPIELPEGTNIKVKCINVSGASISPSAGTSLDVRTILIVEKVIL